jgi:hypothetical protein
MPKKKTLQEYIDKCLKELDTLRLELKTIHLKQ